MSLLNPILQFDFKSTFQTTSASGETVTMVSDHSGNNYDGTVKSGCKIHADDTMGNCLEFIQGETPHVDLPALAADFSDGLTINLLVKASDLTDGCIVELSSNDSNAAIQVGSGTGPYAQIDGKSIGSTPALNMTEWYHLSIAIDKEGNAIFYRNGVPQQSNPVNTGVKPKGFIFNTNTLGKGLGGNNVATIGYFIGSMAWCTVYNTGLSQPEVFDDMCKGISSHIKLSPSLNYDFKAIQPPAQGADSIGTIADLSGNGHDGTVEQGCTLVSDPMMGNCMEFDGQSGYVKLPALPDTGATDLATELTITSWINIAAFDEGYPLLGLGSMKDTAVFLSAVNGGLINYSNYTKGENVLESSLITPADASIQANQWVHYAITIDGSGNAAIYIDGKQVFETNEPNAKLLPLASVVSQSNRIGSVKNGGSRLKGKMAWLSVYNTALKWEQVLADMYQATAPPQELKPGLQFDFSTIVPSAESTVGKILDASGNGYDGIVQSGCSLVNDPIMGNCLEFDGTGTVKLPSLSGVGDTDLSKEFTFTCWIKTQTTNDPYAVFSSGSSTDNVLAFIVGSSGTGKMALDYVNESNGKPTPLGPFYVDETNQWFHLAFSINTSGIGKIYLNGTEIFKNNTADLKLLPAANIVSHDNNLGAVNLPSFKTYFFQGRMAWLCLYNKALKKQEINADMVKGESNRQVSFRKSFPVDFKVYSENNYDQVPTLFIEQEGQGKDLYLEISNEDLPELNIPVVANGTASASDYHFQLRFRPGTLSSNFLKSQPSISGWSVAVGTQSGSGTEYISLLCTKNIDSIGQGNSHTLSIPSVNADPAGGARNTHVEFNYKLASNLSGTRLQSLSVISHLGQKDIPLHVDVVGAPQVLNDGSTYNNLLFRIENTGAGSVNLNEANAQGQTASAPAPSRFELEVLAQPTGEFMEWALVEQDQVSSLTLDWPAVGTAASCPAPTKSGTAYTFKLTLQDPLPFTIKANDKLNIQPPKGSFDTFTLANTAREGSTDPIELTKTISDPTFYQSLISDGIPTRSLITLTSFLGELASASDKTNTLSLSSGLLSSIPANTNLIISPAPKIYAKVLDYNDSGNILTFTSKYSLLEGSIISTLNPVGSAKGTNNDTTINLVQKHSGTVPAGTHLNITSPTGAKTVAKLAVDSENSDALKVVQPITVVEGSTISYSNEVGTITTSTSDSDTATITPYTPANGSPITPAAGMFLVIASSLTAPLQVTSKSAGVTSITLTKDLKVNVPAGSIVSLAAAQQQWQIIQNNQTPDLITGTVSWSITSESVTEIKPGASIEFWLNGIVSKLPAGTSTITLKYYNIPGYWDGELEIPVQKGPVIYNGQKVGIGTIDPNTTLEVEGTILSKGLTVKGPTIIGKNDTKELPEYSSDGHGGLAVSWNYSDHVTGNAKAEVDLFNTYKYKNGHAFHFYQMDSASQAKLLMAISQAGNVGIGTTPLSHGTLVIPYPDGNSNSKHKNRNGIVIGDPGGDKTNYSALAIFIDDNTKHPHSAPYPFSIMSNSDKPLMVIDRKGNVGIGAKTPDSPLVVRSAGLPQFVIENNQKQAGSNPDGKTRQMSFSLENNGFAKVSTHDGISFIAAGSERMRIDSAGNMGIGTPSPGSMLDVNGAINSTMLTVSGNVAIGTTTNSNQVPLLIQSTTNNYFGSGSYKLNYQGLNIIDAGQGNEYTTDMLASNSIGAKRFFATSDDRIKSEKTVANAAKDLDVLLELKVTDYRYLDKVREGNRKTKGLIAQELEQTFPQAVNRHADFIPNIYVLAKKIKRDKKKKELTIRLAKKHKVKIGDVLELIIDSNQRLEKEVVAVPGPKELVVGSWTEETKKLFVIGKMVDDMRAIDYHQVAMLNVSATQEIHKQLEATQKDNKQLKKECKRLKKESEQLKQQYQTDMEALRGELASLKEMITNLQ